MRIVKSLLAVVVFLHLVACGGGGSASNTPPPTATTYALTVNSSAPSSGVAISVSPADNNGASGGTTSFTRIYKSGSSVTLTAPTTSGNNSFSSWSGCTSKSAATCTVMMTSNATVTANYNASGITTPTVTVTPTSSSITTAQSLQVSVSVTASGSGAIPTGTVTLASGDYTSSAATLITGAASITIPAGVLATGNDTLKVTYTPDSTSAALYASASGTASIAVALPTFVLTVNSASPSSGVLISASPSDNNGATSGTTGFTRTYNSGTAVVLSAPATSGSYSFFSWSGCTTSTATTCNVTMTANKAVTATYSQPGISSISISPNAAIIGTQQQFTATVTGTGNFSNEVTWALSCPLCGKLSPGTLSSTGLYITPYPAPASVTITATSTADSTKSGSVTVTLSSPPTTAGPALSVDAASQTHPISPLIYGINGFDLDQQTATAIHPSLIRWGGDDTSRYNYQNTWSNDGKDYYFENTAGAQGRFPNVNGGTTFNEFVSSTIGTGAIAVGTVPLIGWVTNGSSSCSYPASMYPNQAGYNADQCGVGYYANGVNGCASSSGCNITGVSPTVTSIQKTPPDITSASTPAPGSPSLQSWAAATWSGGWVNSIRETFGPANGGSSVAIWDLDNEPTWWNNVHRDVHPNAFTYDEVTNSGIGTALAIKTVDPTALVSGPVIDNWWTFFYSESDVTKGYAKAPCYKPWSNPTDRAAHGGVPMIEYYLQQFNSYSQAYGIRLLDYLDIHGYFSPKYNGSSVGLTTAGDTAEQIARLNGTRVFWDSTYTDSNFPQPNYTTDSNYTSSCTPPAQAPQLIPMLQGWVAKNYPGTKVAIDEYNFGGLESINGAIAQADILGIFGRQGVDMAAFWPTTNYSTQVPGNMAFAIYRNYDGENSTFGDIALNSASTSSLSNNGEGQLAVYGALRSSDNALTVVVINKTFGDLTSTLSLANVPASSTSAQEFLYSNADLTKIVRQSNVTLTKSPDDGTTGTITTTFPAQSITLFVVPE